MSQPHACVHTRAIETFAHRKSEEFQVPDQFCCSCLLPIWTLYDEQKVHDQDCGGACTNSLKDYGKMLLVMKKEGLLPQFKESIPGSTHAEAWNWLFNSRIPGILQLFGCIAPNE
jgi:hypothetical protein